MLRIVPTHLHGIGPDPQHDLCAHGGVEVWAGGALWIGQGGAELAVSTGALHLLRTLRADHTPDAPVAEHLVPCCGHFMWLDEAGALSNLGCPDGLNWWVRHEADAVVLTRDDGASVRASASDWCGAVARFADEVDAFYAASPPRVPGDEHTAQWYAALRAEWARLRTSAELP